MERSQNPVWIQCLTAIEPVLGELGFHLASESHLYSSFGSASVEYERSDMRIELFWDGKENWIDAHYATRNRNERHLWSPRQTIIVEPPLTNIRAHVLRPGIVADEYIGNLILAVRRLATGPRSLR
jgi:hypothetical protein